MKKIKILDIQFDVCTKDEALARIFEFLKNRAGSEPAKHIVTPNPEMLLCATRNKNFREVLNRAWLSIPDGIGILWASTFQHIAKANRGFVRLLKGFFSLLSLLIYPKFCQKVFPQRITGVDLMESICAISKGSNLKIFLLGAAPEIAEKVKQILEMRYPGLKIVGTLSGSPSPDDFPGIHAILAELQPDILFVAYGAPAQELWIAEHLNKLKSVKIAMGVGGAFDFITGHRMRAPRFMQHLGIEWMYRLIQEPSRLKRIYNAAIKFPLKIIFSSGR